MGIREADFAETGRELRMGERWEEERKKKEQDEKGIPSQMQGKSNANYFSQTLRSKIKILARFGTKS